MDDDPLNRIPVPSLVLGLDHFNPALLGHSCQALTDQKIATELFHAGVAIADVEHAILLGSLRKYVALINNGRGTPITSLRYFAALFDEVKQDISPGYWMHVERRVRDAERQWGGFEVPSNQTK